MVRSHLPILALFLAFCGGGSNKLPRPAADAPVAVTDGPQEGPAVTVGRANVPEGNRYREGDQLCCAKGEATACCAEGKPSSTCAEYGGLYHDCVGEGEEYEGKVSCGHCCNGLVRAGLAEPTDASGPGIDNGCDSRMTPPALGICVRCGDGICGPGENRCRCAQDCVR